MNLGFDLDKVLIHYPPVIPDWIIDSLYKDRDGEDPRYKNPGIIEQQVRKLSHLPFLRQPVKENLNALRTFSRNSHCNIYLVSGRLGFLKSITSQLITRYRLDTIFTDMFFDFENEQAHLFKDRIIKKYHIERYIDDDFSLITYLAKKNPKILFYWYNSRENKKVTHNMFATTYFTDIFKNL